MVQDEQHVLLECGALAWLRAKYADVCLEETLIQFSLEENMSFNKDKMK